MNKTCLVVIVLIFATAESMFAIQQVVINKIVLNGKVQPVAIAAHQDDGALFLEAHVNYKERTSVENILAVLRALKQN